MIVVLTAVSWSQEADTDPTPAFGTEVPYTETLTPPLPVSGLRMPLAFSSDSGTLAVDIWLRTRHHD